MYLIIRILTSTQNKTADTERYQLFCGSFELNVYCGVVLVALKQKSLRTATVLGFWYLPKVVIFAFELNVYSLYRLSFCKEKSFYPITK